MTINLKLATTAPRIAQVAVGGAALVGGWTLASSVARNAYREDLLGDPTRIVETDGTTTIYQTREPQGGALTKFMIGAGAASAFAGSALLLGKFGPKTGVLPQLKAGGGVALFALGLGAIAGAAAIAKSYKGADFEPVR